MIRTSHIILEGPRTSTGNHCRCTACSRLITEPGLCRTGGVLDSPLVKTLMSSGVTQEGLFYLKSRIISITRYTKGFLCDQCAGCYYNVRVGNDLLPLIKVDALHGLPKPRDSREGTRRNTVLNTRFTR